jgi:DNA replication and repair protein RecF
MPLLEQLSVRNFRILREVDVTFAGGVNVVCGANGSGKTSLLEAIYLLGTGKSFRSPKPADYIAREARSTVVSGRVLGGRSAGASMLGIEKAAHATLCRIDGLTVAAASELARHFSVVALDAQAFRVLDDGPAIRRALIDRALFHVEPSYFETYKLFHRALRHRNELLKQQAPLRDAEYWNHQLSVHASLLDDARRRCVDQFNAWVAADKDASRWGSLSFDYRAGWRRDTDLEQLLADAWPRDLEARTTSLGPHRAELRILLDGRVAASAVSRGQGKLLICALTAAQANFISAGTGIRPTLLIDDISSELDRDSCKAALSLLLGGGGQAFITAIESTALEQRLPSAPEGWFHVERGTLTAA